MPVLLPVYLMLDGPLCHSATNGHCWASHFLNDTLLRSIQLPCSYTLTPLPLFSFPPYSLNHFLSCTTQWLPSLVWKKSSFLSIFSQYFPLNMPLDERPSSCLTHTHHTHTHALSCITYQRPNDWLTMYDWSIFSPLIAAPSPTGWFVYSSFIPLPLLSLPSFIYLLLPQHTTSLPLFLIIFILLYVCVFVRLRACVRVSSRGWRSMFPLL